MSRKSAGFTLPELIVVIVVMSLMTTSIISSSVTWFRQYAIGDTRQTMTVNIQATLGRISDDIRQSYAVLAQNAETDPNAPTPAGVWSSSSNQLVLAKTPRKADGTALYDSPQFFTGKPDSIVYYINNNVLYRRIVPANYTGNVNLPLATCGGTPGCPSDTKILANITSLQFTYYDTANTAGSTPANTRSIVISVATTQQQSGQTINAQDSIRVKLQKFTTIVPKTPDAGGGTLPSGSLPQTTAGLIVGPGGLQTGFSDIVGRDLYIFGRVILSAFSQIDTSGYRFDVANYGCGNRSTTPLFPSPCTGQQPIIVSFLSSAAGTPICATGQTIATGLTGLQNGCTAPGKAVPTFNKGNFTGTMTSTVSSQSCSTFSSTAIAAKTKVTGSVSANFCTILFGGDAYIKGNLTVGGNSIIRVAEGVTNRPIIVVNGQVTVTSSNIQANSAGVTPYIISFYSPNSALSCPSSDTCNSVTNADIYDAVNSPNAAISVGGNSGINASLYAYFGILNLSASTMTGAVAGQKVIVGNNSSIRLADGTWPS